LRIVEYYPWALKGEFGTAIAVRGWSTALANAGDDVVLVTGVREDKVVPPAGVEIVRLPTTPRDIPRPGGFRDVVRGADLMVVHGGWDVRNLIAARDAASLGVPYVVVPHGAFYPQVFVRRHRPRKVAWWRLLERRYLERALAIHVFFDPEAADLRARGIDRPMVVAPNGYVAPEGVVWSPSEGPPSVAWLGRYDIDHKGTDLLLRGLATLDVAERPRLRLAGVDWHGGRRVLERLSAELRLEEFVSIGSPVYGDAKWDLIAGSAGFVYPSRWDASPMAVVEAASIGVPTLTGPIHVGRFLEARGAAITAAADPFSIADGLRKLLSPDSASMGAKGAEVVRSELSWSHVAATWRRQIEAVLGGEVETR
jgi:glycosyltransferase involved in cell wall biosynthesis